MQRFLIQCTNAVFGSVAQESGIMGITASPFGNLPEEFTSRFGGCGLSSIPTMMHCLGQWHPMMQDAVGHPDLKKKKKKSPLSIMRVGYSLHLRTEHTMKQLVESEFNMTVFPPSLNKLLP